MKAKAGDLVQWQGWWYLVDRTRGDVYETSYIRTQSGTKSVVKVPIDTGDVEDVISNIESRDEAYLMIDVMERLT